MILSPSGPQAPILSYIRLVQSIPSNFLAVPPHPFMPVIAVRSQAWPMVALYIPLPVKRVQGTLSLKSGPVEPHLAAGHPTGRPLWESGIAYLNWTFRSLNETSWRKCIPFSNHSDLLSGRPWHRIAESSRSIYSSCFQLWNNHSTSTTIIPTIIQ